MSRTSTRLISKAAEAHAQQQAQLAIEYLQQALSVEPQNTTALGELAALRLNQGQTLVARALAFAASRRDPETPRWHEIWSRAHLSHVTNATEVRRYWQRLQDLQPDNPLPVMYLSDSHFVVCDFARALPYARQAVVMDPNNVNTHVALAKCLLSLRQLDEAAIHFARALALNSAPAVLWEHAMYLLLTGDFARGWVAYESRLTAFNPLTSGQRMFPFPFPQWQGQSLAGKTILVHGEQGLGDEIMFSSQIPDLIALGGKVTLACSPSLTSIMQRSFPAVTCVEHNRSPEAVANWQRGNTPLRIARLGEFDYQCPLGSLAQHLRTDLASLRARAKPYLRADPHKVSGYRQQFHQRLPADHNGLQPIYIGLVWSGNRRTGTMGQFKSMDIETLEPLHSAAQALSVERGVPVVFVSLHDAEYGAEVATVPDWHLLDFQTSLSNFDETAALASACDWVISVDTSVCHLCAALGLETWVPLRFAADWRYLHGLDYGVWYDTMRLFRQQQDGDWTPVVQQLQTAMMAKLRILSSAGSS